MLTPRIRLGASQKEDLAVICAIGVPKLTAALNTLAVLGFTISRQRIEKTIGAEVGDENGEILSRILFGIGSAFRRSLLSPEEALAGVTLSLGDALQTDKRF